MAWHGSHMDRSQRSPGGAQLCKCKQWHASCCQTGGRARETVADDGRAPPWHGGSRPRAEMDGAVCHDSRHQMRRRGTGPSMPKQAQTPGPLPYCNLLGKFTGGRTWPRLHDLTAAGRYFYRWSGTAAWHFGAHHTPDSLKGEGGVLQEKTGWTR
jgi:hypothetical protein